MAALGSEKLRLKALNIEKGNSRFPRSEGFDPPELAAWRNNLAALSQRHNLLFTAQNRKIYVWEPTGPWQTLGRTPALILTPVMKNPNARGYLSRIVMRHAINHIIVDELGDDEVLLLATDSGNVCGYRVDSFYQSIERARAAGETLPVQEPHIEPFLCEHVGASAWGLAVHKLARLVAVSCNACTINVFAFALVDSRDQGRKSDDTDHCYTQEWVTIDTLDDLRYFRNDGMLSSRSHNLRLIYQGHRHNIPSVSFFNYDLVSDGAWMVSVDIENRVIFWNIWKSLDPWTEVDLRLLARNDPRFIENERGWSVIALDPRSFRFRRTFAEAIDSHNYKKFADVGEFPAMRDVTDPNDTLPDYTRGYPFVPPVQKANPDEVLDEFFPDIIGEANHSINSAKRLDSPRGTKRNLSEEDSDESEPEKHEQLSREQPSAPDVPDTSTTPRDSSSSDERRENRSGDGAEQPVETRSPEPAADRGPPDPDELMDSFRRRILNIVRGNEGTANQDDDIGFLMETLGELLALPELESEEGESSDESDDLISVRSVTSVEAEGEQEDELESLRMDGRIFPVLQFSEEHIRMIPGPMAGRPTVISGSHRQMFIYTTDAMRQLEDFQRFNMVKYIPEDGLVLAASQMGRVAIMSLGEAHLKGPTFRFHWVVPLKSQEKYGDRPMVPLVGMAVSPVQGQERPVDLSNCRQARHDPLIDKDECLIEVASGGLDGDSDLPSAESNTPSTSRYRRPCERWQGWQSSRRYRLLLIYGDHTVMSYEFWYESGDCDNMIL